MEDDRGIAWRLQLEELFSDEQIELLNLSETQRLERMAQFLQDVFEMDGEDSALSNQAVAPPEETQSEVAQTEVAQTEVAQTEVAWSEVAQSEVTQKGLMAETPTENEIVDDLNNLTLKTPQAKCVQVMSEARERSRGGNAAGIIKQKTLSYTIPEATPMMNLDASASPGHTERHEENQPQAECRGSGTACSFIEAHVEGQQQVAEGGSGSSCPTRDRIQPQAGNGGAGSSFVPERRAGSRRHAEGEGADSSSPAERADESHTEARNRAAGSSCPAVRRAEIHREGPNEEAGSASPTKRQTPEGSPGAPNPRSQGATRADEYNSSTFYNPCMAEMAQRLDDGTATIGPEDMRALQEAVDQERFNRAHLGLLRGDARVLRNINRPVNASANQAVASQIRALYSAGLLRHPSRQPMHFGNEVVFFEPAIPQASSETTENNIGSPNVRQSEAEKYETNQPKDEAARSMVDSENDLLPECPQRPNTPLNLNCSRKRGVTGGKRKERVQQVRPQTSANVCVPLIASRGGRHDVSIQTEETLNTFQDDEISGLKQASGERAQEAGSEPHDNVASNQSQDTDGSEPQKERDESKDSEGREPQKESDESQDSDTSDENLDEQGPELGTSTSSAQGGRQPHMEEEQNSDAERSRRIAREIISEFNRALDPLFSISPSYVTPAWGAGYDREPDTGPPESDSRDAGATPAPSTIPDDARFMNTLRELYRFVENPRTSGPLSRFSESELVLLRLRLFARRAELQATRAARELNSVELDLISTTFSFTAGTLSTFGQQDAARNTQDRPAGDDTEATASVGNANVQHEPNQEPQSYEFLNDESSITNLIVLIERQIVDIRTRQNPSLVRTFLPSNRESSRESQLAWQYQNLEAEAAVRRFRMQEEFGPRSQDMGAFLRFFWRNYVLQPSGLTPAQLSSLPTMQHSEGTDQAGSSSSVQCSICLYEYNAGDEVRILSCGHRFHRECVDEWLQRTATCPVCRARIHPSENN